MLVEGQAGSGKTTLLKHFCLSTLENRRAESDSAILPVLVFLKDLQQFEQNLKGMPPNAATFEQILNQYFSHTGCGLNVNSVKVFCKAKQCVFLLDGLDEIDGNVRKPAGEIPGQFPQQQ